MVVGSITMLLIYVYRSWPTFSSSNKIEDDNSSKELVKNIMSRNHIPITVRIVADWISYDYYSDESVVATRSCISYCSISALAGEIYNLPVNLFNFPVKQEKRCINPPLRAGDRVRVRVRVS